MRIAAAETRLEAIPLARPYTITFRTVTAIETVIVVLRDEYGHLGLGAASPESHVTGETNQACQTALAAGALDWLIGQDLRSLPAVVRVLGERMKATPAARAAVDMALHDLLAQVLDLPLCDLLGRVHERLPTSITIGIKDAEETLREADEYLGRGFRILKVKIGRQLEEDLDRLRRLRDRVGPDIILRADANQGYTLPQTERFLREARPLGLELVEQPIAARQTRMLAALDEPSRRLLVADESLLTAEDAFALALPPPPCGVYNIKLMKCGGVSPALRIASVAELAGLTLMWGCMDESRIGISAALHTAFACPATRFLDLDGSFDLARDVVEGGFELDQGFLSTTPAPGLGVRLR
jgi:L-alanine-DL-glutamate epimerase-like enolase superfamily enzyme